MPKVSEELAKRFATEKGSKYQDWVRNEGLDIIAGHYVPNLHHVDVKPWPRRGEPASISTTRRRGTQTTVTCATFLRAGNSLLNDNCTRR
ncbi:hypothetical protein GCM10025859_18980 [Alicyclobacillus fastidiosus]|nr:hypothetical protein GCM10025859_18980 [Alicyclobacillus fastidiosus]